MANSSGLWPGDADGIRNRYGAPGSFPNEPQPQQQAQDSGRTFVDHDNPSASESTSQGPPNPDPGVYGPRTCRICLEVNHPSMIPSTIPSIPGLAPRPPRVVYESSEPELGRLISPCKCKGSSRYVHEGCLRQWRMAAPSRDRNYWKCPTCGYQYRLERLYYASMIQSLPSQVVLTILVFIVAMFITGFIADPIINTYLDPWSSLGGIIGFGDFFDEPAERLHLADEGPLNWAEHFLKGMAGLGVVGCLKVLLTSPLQFWRFRLNGSSSSGRRSTGRDRVNDISWLVILIGVGTTLWGIYKGVRAFSRRVLMATAERVVDIDVDDPAGN